LADHRIQARALLTMSEGALIGLSKIGKFNIWNALMRFHRSCVLPLFIIFRWFLLTSAAGVLFLVVGYLFYGHLPAVHR